MIESGKTYLVMGLLDPDSIAFAIGRAIEAHGGSVVYTMQNERFRKIFLGRSKKITQEEKDALKIKYCDITIDEEVATLFRELNDEVGPLAGIIHSIAYSNPKTCLGPDFHTEATEDILAGFHISAVSLATVARHAHGYMTEGGALLALSFAAELAFPYYNWMGVNKAALEGVVRGLARRHGKDLIRVNALSAGPILTKAGGSIPGFEDLGSTWERMSPLPWDPTAEVDAVADAALFMISPYARKITGQVVYVDGGASITGGEMLPHERPAS